MSDILGALDKWAQTRGADIAFSDAETAMSFATLARRVAGAAGTLAALPERLGILGPSSIDWLICDFAAWLTGKTLIPLPHFFADEQLRHIVEDAGVTTVLASPDLNGRAGGLGLHAVRMPREEAAWRAGPMTGERIVYTSGSTGRPKGVVLGPRQLLTTCDALSRVVAPKTSDTHLSVLPFSLLLEAVCGGYLPILAGGRCHIDPTIIAAQGAEIAVRLGEAVGRIRPSTMVLVPELLRGWMMVAAVGRSPVPDSLRFVAVGGAAVPDAVADRAWQLGIPVHEGYGLTECGSVVAVNAPGQRRPGTVGRPLPGYDITIAPDGEITVDSASVCAGYLGGTARQPTGRWRTGDLGRLDDDGYLHVFGRKDNLIVTGNGRNIAPEWVENMLLADPRIGRCVVLPDGDGRLAVLLEPSALGAGWFAKADEARLRGLVEDLTQTAPAYAIPRRVVALVPESLAIAGLLTANGRPRRRVIAHHYADRLTPHQHTPETRIHAIL